LTPPKEKGKNFLKRIDFEINENKQSFVFDRQQVRVAATAIPSFARLPLDIVLRDMVTPSFLKGNQESVKLVGVQAREGAQNTSILFEIMIGKHRAPF
jgi:hypothetical protein